MATSDAPKSLTDLVAAFRASYQVYRDSHWRVHGNDFYGNHLLLERIYEDTAKDVDRLAERTVGLYGDDWLESGEQLTRVAFFAQQFHRPDPMTSAWLAASELHGMIQKTYEDLSRRGSLSLGTDDLLMELQSIQEQHLYLLQQAENVQPLSTKKLKTRLLK